MVVKDVLPNTQLVGVTCIGASSTTSMKALLADLQFEIPTTHFCVYAPLFSDVSGVKGVIVSEGVESQIVGTICYVDTEYDMPCFQTLLTVDATLSGYNWIAQSTDAMQSTIRTALTLINPNRGLTRFREGMRNVKLQLSYMETVGSGMNQAETSIQHVHTLSEVSRILKAVANSCSIGPQPS